VLAVAGATLFATMEIVAGRVDNPFGSIGIKLGYIAHVVSPIVRVNPLDGYFTQQARVRQSPTLLAIQGRWRRDIG